MKTQNKFSQNIVDVIQNSNITAYEISKKSGVSQTFLGQLLKKNANINPDKAEKVLSALNYDLKWVIKKHEPVQEFDIIGEFLNEFDTYTNPGDFTCNILDVHLNEINVWNIADQLGLNPERFYDSITEMLKIDQFFESGPGFKVDNSDLDPIFTGSLKALLEAYPRFPIKLDMFEEQFIKENR